jgi:Ulp1 family protease
MFVVDTFLCSEKKRVSIFLRAISHQQMSKPTPPGSSSRGKGKPIIMPAGYKSKNSGSNNMDTLTAPKNTQGSGIMDKGLKYHGKVINDARSIRQASNQSESHINFYGNSPVRDYKYNTEPKESHGLEPSKVQFTTHSSRSMDHPNKKSRLSFDANIKVSRINETVSFKVSQVFRGENGSSPKSIGSTGKVIITDRSLSVDFNDNNSSSFKLQETPLKCLTIRLSESQPEGIYLEIRVHRETYNILLDTDSDLMLVFKNNGFSNVDSIPNSLLARLITMFNSKGKVEKIDSKKVFTFGFDAEPTISLKDVMSERKFDPKAKPKSLRALQFQDGDILKPKKVQHISDDNEDVLYKPNIPVARPKKAIMVEQITDDEELTTKPKKEEQIGDDESVPKRSLARGMKGKSNNFAPGEYSISKSWYTNDPAVGVTPKIINGKAKMTIKDHKIIIEWNNKITIAEEFAENRPQATSIKISLPQLNYNGIFVQIIKIKRTWYCLIDTKEDMIEIFKKNGFSEAKLMGDSLIARILNFTENSLARAPNPRRGTRANPVTTIYDSYTRIPLPPLVPAPLTNNEYELLTRLFHYPPGEKFAIVVREQDAHRLNEGEYLNDTIIEFYLRYLRQNSEIVTFPSTYFYNTFFYNQMKRKDDKSSGGEFGYEKIKKWTKNVDIFNFEYLVVPICEAMHWYLAIIYNPGAALKEEEGVDKEMAETKVKNIHVKKISAISIDSDEVVSSSHEHKGLYRIDNEVDEIEEIEEDVIEFGSTGCEQKFEEMDSFESIDELTQSHVKGAKEESVLELASSPKINNLKVSKPVFVEEDSLLRLTEPELIEDDEKEFPNNLGNSINLLAESGENVQTPQPKEEDDSLMIIEELQELVTVQETSSKATKKVSVKSKGKSKERSKKYDGEKNNCNIIILDSLGIERPSTISKLKTYLVLEAKHRKGIVVNLKNIKGVYAKVPIQPNTCDCGVYLLHYVEIFFKDPIKLRDMILHRVGTKQDWFDIRDIPEKRKLIMGLINSYTTETGKAEKVICPTVSPMDVSDDDDLQIIEL